MEATYKISQHPSTHWFLEARQEQGACALSLLTELQMGVLQEI